MDRLWLYVHNGQEEGPVLMAELVRLLREGVVDEDTGVWTDGMATWVALGSTAGRQWRSCQCWHNAGTGSSDTRASKRWHVELRQLPGAFATWLPGLDKPSKKRLFVDGLVFCRPQDIDELPAVRDALLAAYVQQQ